jgi:hypothetical protein
VIGLYAQNVTLVMTAFFGYTGLPSNGTCFIEKGLMSERPHGLVLVVRDRVVPLAPLRVQAIGHRPATVLNLFCVSIQEWNNTNSTLSGRRYIDSQS